MPGKKITILTSGGDAPGMNAAIRSIVREGCYLGHEVWGAARGYYGLLRDEFRPLGPRDVSNILQRGGTILHTSRCPEFENRDNRILAAENLRKRGIDALLAIGGDGTFRGCQALAEDWGGQIIGLPGTIDNDLYGTDSTIGFDTAVSTALDAIDKIRDTAEAHERFFLVEVMGRNAGFIALHVGLNGGAEEILVPEDKPDLKAVCDRLCEGRKAGKTSSILVVAEGAYPGGAHAVAEELRRLSGNEYRICVLGYLQRGGSPTGTDRMLATRLGATAVHSILVGETGKMAGMLDGKPVLTLLEESFGKKKSLDPELLALARRLAS